MKNYTTQIMNKLKEMEQIINKRHSIEKRTEFGSLLATLITQRFVLFPAIKASNVLIELGWFFTQVTHRGPWDLKVDESWRKTIGIEPIPAYGVKGKPNEKFLFSGKAVNREELGNITYGYLGKAMNFPDVIIYLGGGVAAQGKNLKDMIINSAKNLEVLKPPYYGDSKDDHEWVEFGINLYKKSH